MAPPRKHQTDAILDATRTLVLADGPRAASVTAIAAASGAPAGTLYHRFGSRDGVLAATWLRALQRFQARAMEPDPGSGRDEALECAVAMGLAAVTFARDTPDDARLLLSLRPADLVDDHGPFDHTLAELNRPLGQRIRDIARLLYGSADARSVDAVSRAVVDLPYAAVRRHGGERALPSWLAGDLEAGIHALLIAHRS